MIDEEVSKYLVNKNNDRSMKLYNERKLARKMESDKTLSDYVIIDGTNDQAVVKGKTYCAFCGSHNHTKILCFSMYADFSYDMFVIVKLAVENNPFN